jgi:hypothetical protein
MKSQYVQQIPQKDICINHVNTYFKTNLHTISLLYLVMLLAFMLLNIQLSARLTIKEECIGKE